MEARDHHSAVRRSYDAVAADYLAELGDELDGKPLDRAVLSALIERHEPEYAICDVGCGPGHVAAWLADHGARAVGIDLSDEMVAVGRRNYPQVEFRVGDFLNLPAADGEFGSAIAFYSIVHLEPDELGSAFGEIRRVLRKGGQLLVSFHVGIEVVHRSEWWGHDVDVDFRLFEVPRVIEHLAASGFVLEARLERRHYPAEVETMRAYLLATRAP